MFSNHLPALLALALSANVAWAVPPCTDPARPNAICVQYSRPFTENAFFWQSLNCGINPPSTSSFVGDNLEKWDFRDGCLTPFFATCCTTINNCGAAVNCDVETNAPVPTPAFLAATNPWKNTVTCAVDNPARVLANVVTTTSPGTTPFQCMNLCQSKGLHFAGVENGNECHCGTGFAGGVAPPNATIFAKPVDPFSPGDSAPIQVDDEGYIQKVPGYLVNEMYRSSSPIFDVPEFPALRRVKPLPKRRRTSTSSSDPIPGSPSSGNDIIPPLIEHLEALKAKIALGASVEELRPHAESLSAYLPLGSGSEEQLLNRFAAEGGGSDDEQGDGDYVDHLRQPGNTKKRKVPANSVHSPRGQEGDSGLSPSSPEDGSDRLGPEGGNADDGEVEIIGCHDRGFEAQGIAEES
ncbi:hypothetical protein ONZ45_g11192 [Pleurotus djamor]|nr:hypothetical protein ONZ45_g11192 [Pleurotus djamor]